MNNLENEVKALIIEALNLEDMTPEDIETEEVRAHFRSVASLAAFIRENRTEEK